MKTLPLLRRPASSWRDDCSPWRRTPMRRLPARSFVLLLVAAFPAFPAHAAPAADDPPASFQPSAATTLAELVAHAERRSSAVAAAGIAMDAAAGELQQARLWPNLSFDFMWGT